jgi:hypothetical protein
VLNKKKWVAAAASVMLLAACAQGPSSSAPAPASAAANPAAAGVPVTVTCAQGQQALVKQVTLGGQTVSQVECVAAPGVASQELGLVSGPLEVAQAAPPARRAAPRRVVRRELPPLPREDVVDAEEPTVTRASTSPSSSEPVPETRVKKTRPAEQSALIIAGSTAAGAGVGAAVGGKRGAIIGAILGGVGGTVYDRKTRKK